MNTIVVIACYVARRHLCSLCTGSTHQHDQHDLLFGGYRVHAVCIATWLYSLAILTPIFTGASATFGWTGSMFGCDWVPTPGTKIPIGGFFMIINNFIFILIFYGIVIIHLCKEKHKVTRKKVVTRHGNCSLDVHCSAL